jgi:hypothetical protein
MKKSSAERIFYHPPISSASFLNLSHKNFSQAERLQTEAFKRKSEDGILPDGEHIEHLELKMASVVFAYTALEAFANDELPEVYIYLQEDKKFTKHYNKGQIERFLSLDMKLGDVLPEALRIKTPKGTNFWSSYIELGHMRDNIIHMKAKDSSLPSGTEDIFWNKLIFCSSPPFKTAKDLMKYFFDLKGKSPDWFKRCPF